MKIKIKTSLLAASVALLNALAGTPAPLQAAPGQAEQAITVTELRGLGGGSGLPYDIDASGRVVGSSGSRPVMWENGRATDLAPSLPADAVGLAEGIGDDGRIVGYLSRALPAGGGPGVVTWFGGRVTTLSRPPASGDEAIDINNRSQILYRDGGRTFLWSNGVTTPAPDLAPGVPLELTDINEWGLVTGTSAPGDPQGRRAYVWLPGLPPVQLGTLGGSWSEALAVNDLGQMVGFSETAAGERRMFVTQGVSMVDLGTLGGAEVDYLMPPGLAPRLLNNRGHVVGTSTTAAGDTHAFLWRDGRMTDLGTLGAGRRSFAVALNDLDQVVGFSAGGAAHIAEAFVWQGGRMFDLGRLTEVPGRLVSFAYLINSRGQAIGQTVPTAGGDTTRGWLWTVPPWIRAVTSHGGG